MGTIPGLEKFDLFNIYMINLKAEPEDGINDPMVVQLRNLLNRNYNEFKNFLNENQLGDWDIVEEVTEKMNTIRDEGIAIGRNEGFQDGKSYLSKLLLKEFPNLSKNSKNFDELEEKLIKFLKEQENNTNEV